MVILRRERAARIASVGNCRIVGELPASGDGEICEASIVDKKRTRTLLGKCRLVKRFVNFHRSRYDHAPK